MIEPPQECRPLFTHYALLASYIMALCDSIEVVSCLNRSHWLTTAIAQQSGIYIYSNYTKSTIKRYVINIYDGYYNDDYYGESLR